MFILHKEYGLGTWSAHPPRIATGNAHPCHVQYSVESCQGELVRYEDFFSWLHTQAVEGWTTVACGLRGGKSFQVIASVLCSVACSALATPGAVFKPEYEPLSDFYFENIYFQPPF